MNVALILLFVAGLLFYFLPALLASQRDHPNRQAILVLNLLLGWSLIGWVVALVWAFTSSRSEAIPPALPHRHACPFCAEDIHANALKCKHCGSDLTTGTRRLISP